MKKLSVKEVEGWEKRYNERFSFAFFTWNGDNFSGETEARKARATMKKFIRQELAQARESERAKITKELDTWHAETMNECKELRTQLDRYSDDYKHGILRGYTLFGRYLHGLLASAEGGGRI